MAAALPRDKALLYLGIGDFSFRHGELSDAERWFERGTRSYPDDVNLHLYHGKVYWKRERLAEANAAFERALQLTRVQRRPTRALVLFLEIREGRQRHSGSSSLQSNRGGALRMNNVRRPAVELLHPGSTYASTRRRSLEDGGRRQSNARGVSDGRQT